MAKYHVNKANSPIVSQITKNNLSKFDICRLLNISLPTLNDYINNPYQIRFGDIHKLASIFNLGILEFVYLIDRNKPKLKKTDKWFIESKINKDK